MAAHITYKTLDEIAQVIDSAHKTPIYSESGYPMIRATDIKGGILRLDETKRVEKDIFEEFSKNYKCSKGDIVITRVGSYGLFSYVNTNELFCLGQNTAAIKPRIDSRYLYYCLLSPFVKHQIEQSIVGSTQKTLSLGHIKKLKIPIFKDAEIKVISRILSSLDDKIELNRRMNATLEAMARDVFKAWFVDFEPVHADMGSRPSESASPEIAKLFPSEFENGIPKGWQEKSLDEIAHFLNGLALQRFPPENHDEFLPVIKIAQLRKGNTEGSDKASKNLNRDYIVQDGDVLFSWSGSLEVEIWCGGEGALNQHLFKVTSKEYPKWFYFLWTRHYLSSFRDIAAHKATTMGHIQRYHLREAKVLVPNSTLLREMNKIFEPIIERFILNLIENRNLLQIRNELLPKLLSGQIPVAEIRES